MIEFSLLGETILEWDANDLENYHSQRMVMDSILCGFKIKIKNYECRRICKNYFGRNCPWCKFCRK